MKSPSRRSRIGSLPILVVTALSIVHSPACSKHPRPGEGNTIRPAGEPEQYTATVVRTFDDGSRHEVSITREFRSGEMRREEWSQEGRNRALIWLPDLNKGFLLDLDAREYSEVEITPVSAEGRQTGGRDRLNRHNPQNAGVDEAALQVIDRAIDDAPSPDRVETRDLPEEMIDGHRCAVSEQRASFADGHTEITKAHRAMDLGGLALKIETTSEPGAVRIITERRDVSIDVPPEAFAVPPGYKKLSR